MKAGRKEMPQTLRERHVWDCDGRALIQHRRRSRVALGGGAAGIQRGHVFHPDHEVLLAHGHPSTGEQADHRGIVEASLKELVRRGILHETADE
jgi:hypothetical protein